MERWTSVESATVRRLLLAKFRHGDIARLLHRTRGAIEVHIRRKSLQGLGHPPGRPRSG